MKVSLIARQLGLSRRRIDKWIRLDELQEKAGCSRARECSNPSETIYVSVGRRAVGMGARYLRRFGNLATSVAIRNSQKFLSPWRSRKQRSEGISAFPDAPQLEVTTSKGSRQLPLTILMCYNAAT
jgi:hypothetical protein